MEKLLNFLEDIKETLNEAYSNGKRPVLRNREFDGSYVKKDIERLLNVLKNA